MPGHHVPAGSAAAWGCWLLVVGLVAIQPRARGTGVARCVAGRSSGELGERSRRSGWDGRPLTVSPRLRAAVAIVWSGAVDDVVTARRGEPASSSTCGQSTGLGGPGWGRSSVDHGRERDGGTGSASETPGAGRGVRAIAPSGSRVDRTTHDRTTHDRTTHDRTTLDRATLDRATMATNRAVRCTAHRGHG